LKSINQLEEERPMKPILRAVGLTLVLMALGILFTWQPARSSSDDQASRISELADRPDGNREPKWAAIRSATGETLQFKNNNDQAVNGASPETQKIPRMVLKRNGLLTGRRERSVSLTLPAITVPSPGVTATLTLETQAGDPDQGGGIEKRLTVWRGSRWIDNPTGRPRTLHGLTFKPEFRARISAGSGTVSTPTGYFRYRVEVVTGGKDEAKRLLSLERDYAFLMENEWIVALPEVLESEPGAAPDELTIFYRDMISYQVDVSDPTTRLPRAAIDRFVGDELVPAMVEAFRVQSQDWGFTWYPQWISYRPEAGSKRLTVALGDDLTWYHGQAPSIGHAGISLKVNPRLGEAGQYTDLAQKLIGPFHHELFHNHERNLALHLSGAQAIDGQGGAWKFFSEGLAVLASSVGQPEVQLSTAAGRNDYLGQANQFISEDLEASYTEMRPYHAAMYWRFLYESCGGLQGGLEAPSQGMALVRSILETLYSGQVVDIQASNDLVTGIASVMDKALAGSKCPFQSYADSLQAFSGYLYSLRMETIRCQDCRHQDFEGLYKPPRAEEIHLSAEGSMYADRVESSYGMDFIEIGLNENEQAVPLKIEFSAQGQDSRFAVQLWKLRKADGEPVPPTPLAAPVPTQAESGVSLAYELDGVEAAQLERLALVITRLDALDKATLEGSYTLAFVPGGR
jgi:hypothetical protein